MPSFPNFPPVTAYQVAGMRTTGTGVVCMVTLLCQGSLVSNTAASRASHVLQTLPTITGPSSRPSTEDESRAGPLLGATFLLGDPAHPGSPRCCHGWVGGDGSHERNRVLKLWRYPHHPLHLQEHWATLPKELGRRTAATPLVSCHGMSSQGGLPTTLRQAQECFYKD